MRHGRLRLPRQWHRTGNTDKYIMRNEIRILQNVE